MLIMGFAFIAHTMNLNAQEEDVAATEENSENQEKQRKNAGFINLSTLNMHFRSADAANHLKCAPGTSLRA